MSAKRLAKTTAITLAGYITIVAAVSVPTRMSSKYYFCSPKGVFTLKQLFASGGIKVIRRTINESGHAEFYIYQKYNLRWKSGTGWKLNNRDVVLKAIKLAKKHNITTYRS